MCAQWFFNAQQHCSELHKCSKNEFVYINYMYAPFQVVLATHMQRHICHAHTMTYRQIFAH